MNIQQVIKSHDTTRLSNLIFLAFLLIHTTAWTLVPGFVRENLPLDSIEGATWGHQLQWGYDKNPFMNGWLTALAAFLDGHSGWMVYCFSQLSVAACLLCVYALGKKIMTPAYALCSVLLLEGIQYFNFHAIDFNDNTLELGLWAAAIYFFYQAVNKRTLSAWLMTGMFLALGMMAKYYTLALIAALGLYLLRREHRSQLLTLPPYLALAVFIAIIAPHGYWLTQHDYVTVTYVFERADAVPSKFNHLFFPAQFIWQQFEAFIPALILFSFLFIGSKPHVTSPRPVIAKEDRAFLIYAGFGPFVLTAILSLVMGIKLRAGWGMPLQSFWPLLLLMMLPPRLNLTKIIALTSGIFIFTTALLTGYTVSLVDSSDTSSANFPGKEIAATVAKQWQDTYHTPLEYVAGPRWVAGNISYYSKEHPTVFMEWDQRKTTWINIEDFKQKGAVFVWNISAHETLPEEVAKAYPRLEKAAVMEFDWRRNKHHLPPVKLGIAFLPPAN
ncbi:MAG TPA: glycosyltransferase family 39 protein [Gammaproteobacteria bacterium]|jgi:4-amino-4-deoxy-L-arabinose transferase-like glycosyltransferase|nr:glycosyltransferase family 39 protein [Gammaproteobacteria bacterium]